MKSPPPPRKLSKVGDILRGRMYCGDASRGLGKPPVQDAVVVYVNEAHGWFQVQFPCGVRQGYRI